MASFVYNAWKYRQLGDTGVTPINHKTGTLKGSLHTSSYTPSADNHDFFDDLTNEIASTGSYTAGIAGGYTLTVTVSQDNTDDEGVLDATDVSITSATITARYFAIRNDTAVASTSPLVCLIDFGSDQTSTVGTFTVTFAAEGILNLA